MKSVQQIAVGPLRVSFHKTIRLSDDDQSHALPPSLGLFDVFAVKDFANCPASWEQEGYFIAVQETEAMWMSFNMSGYCAALVGAGGINAVTGEKLGLKLENGNYLAIPPQPWLDGFKNTDGTVSQFVATEHKGGKGDTVAEQLIGSKSKTGGIGIAVFEAVDASQLVQNRQNRYSYGRMRSASGGLESLELTSKGFEMEEDFAAPISMGFVAESCVANYSTTRGMSTSSGHKGAVHRMAAPVEMGLGKGGKIVQKIYEDPNEVSAWKETPSATSAIYLIGAEQFAQITGRRLGKVATDENTSGPYFKVHDKGHADVEGSDKFKNLKSAVPSTPGLKSGVFQPE